ncbi:hypothetical protein [Embleya scabrispora]|uniref:hypothetical protein n=1 Tax=Embleya scabrispora TaxID=159449 RepID=UPI001B7FB3F4|nr:hypothetical protein [Embleya scabrispora]
MALDYAAAEHHPCAWCGTGSFLPFREVPGRRAGTGIQGLIDPLVGAQGGHRDEPVVGLAQPSQPLTAHMRGRGIRNRSAVAAAGPVGSFPSLVRRGRLPRITMHDLQHLAATLTITAGVLLTVMSKTLRHSTLSTTANIYAHLTRQAAHDAVDAIEEALVGAEGVDARINLPSRLRPDRDDPSGFVTYSDRSTPLQSRAVR